MLEKERAIIELNHGAKYMKWYAAHVLMTVRFKNGGQTHYPAWENVYLIKGSSCEEIEKRAEIIALRHQGDSAETFFWNDIPAKWVYEGIRKIIEVSDPYGDDEMFGDEVEITYSEIEFSNPDDIEKYVNGEEVTLKAVD